ncbi:MAG: ATP phosphoribosyltransferase [Bacteroidales bacterium]|jgi:ATP phosphoribosyltransferase|nr:ATP phosphoribosyltransferase [Bacteroidales bacterium]
MLRIALQAKGRLNEDSLNLLKESGIKVEESKRKLISVCEGFPVEVVYLRDDDIPQAVYNGIADIGIVGMNEVSERGFKVENLFDLGFGKCRLSLAIPKNEEYTGSDYFQGKIIATSYPNILKKYLKKNGINAKIEIITGSVEIAPSIGMGDAIFDIVSTGGTLISNGLKEVEPILKSEAVLIGNPRISREKRTLVKQLIFRIESVLRSRGKKYILVNVPNDRIEKALKIIPSMKSPTLLPLADKEWSAIHTVIDEKDIWEKTEQLKKIGAEDILILSMEKMIP